MKLRILMAQFWSTCPFKRQVVKHLYPNGSGLFSGLILSTDDKSKWGSFLRQSLYNKHIFIALSVFTVRMNGNYTLYSFYMTTRDILAESQKWLSYLKITVRLSSFYTWAHDCSASVHVLPKLWWQLFQGAEPMLSRNVGSVLLVVSV